jgi:hypothetical protein
MRPWTPSESEPARSRSTGALRWLRCPERPTSSHPRSRRREGSRRSPLGPWSRTLARAGVRPRASPRRCRL